MWLVSMEADMRHFDHMFQFSGLFFNLGCQEQSSCCDGVSVELCKGMKHVEPLHIDNGRVDA